MSKSSKTPRFVLLIFCLSAMLCFNLAADAQSRRQPRPKTVEQTAPVVSPTPPTTDKKAETDETDETPVKITSLKIVGEIQHDALLYGGTDLSNAVKEFVRTLKTYSKNAPVMTRAGKATYTEAKELAKKESGTFVLWFGFVLKEGGYSGMTVDVVQYAVIKPGTGKILTRGEVTLEQTRRIPPVVRLPAPTVRRSPRKLDQMNDCVRYVAAILARAGWLN